jgi:uncharacterized protein (DUF433 family)
MNVINPTVQKTAHPHIVKIDGICGGQTIIEGSRIAVWHIVEYYYELGMSVEDIVMDWNYLTPAQVFSALAYYHDNSDEIDAVREENTYEHWVKAYPHAASQRAQVAS